MRLFSFLLLCLLEIACATKNRDTITADQSWILPDAPPEIEAMIKTNFPGARKGPEFGDSILNYIGRKYDISMADILFGASTCVDDIIFTKNFHAHREMKGPFHLGGLAGLPFSGVSGLDAFAHHIPDSGTMFLLVEPHIGLSARGGWGTILRYEQHEVSSCCGALVGTLAKLKAGKLKPRITEEDYQGGKIAELVLAHEKEILSAPIPIVELTRIVSHEAERQIRSHVLEVELVHIRYIVIITGIMINTDYLYSDYQFVDHIMVYDVRKKAFVEDLKNPLNH